MRVEKVEPTKPKLNFSVLMGNFRRPRDGHLTARPRDDFIKGFAAGGRKMSSPDTRWISGGPYPGGLVRETTAGRVGLLTYGSTAIEEQIPSRACSNGASTLPTHPLSRPTPVDPNTREASAITGIYARDREKLESIATDLCILGFRFSSGHTAARDTWNPTNGRKRCRARIERESIGKGKRGAGMIVFRRPCVDGGTAPKETKPSSLPS